MEKIEETPQQIIQRLEQENESLRDSVREGIRIAQQLLELHTVFVTHTRLSEQLADLKKKHKCT